MSNLLNKVEINNFWGNGTTIKISFDDDVNFLIGPNGSGKTTVLNLIASALSSDFDQLQNFIFDSMTIIFKQTKSNKKPKIILEKNILDENLIYKVYKSSSSKAVEFIFDKYDLNEFTERGRLGASRRRNFMVHTRHRELFNALNELYDVSWLTIHRLPKHLQDERSYESSIDVKIKIISDQLVRYFSLLKTNAQKEIMQFQEFVFLSLISSEENNFKLTSNGLNIKEEKKLLTDIFKEFNIKEQTYYKDVGNHFLKLENVYKKIAKKEQLEGNEGIVILENSRIHKVVNEWIEIKNNRDKIYKPQENFLDILNNLMVTKNFYINMNNELEVELKNKTNLIGLLNLSSGEKQLLIILAETFLQKNKSWLYFADEPELSLHVDWQEKLIKYMKLLNPNAQLIIATHSPDIVGPYQNKIIKMKDVMHG